MKATALDNLEGVSLIVLSNLEKVKSADFLPDLVKFIEKSSISHHKVYYDKVLELHKATHSFPDVSALELAFPGFKPSAEPFSPYILELLTHNVHKEHHELKASELISQGKHDEAQKILSEIRQVAGKPLMSPSRAMAAYHEMTLRASGMLTGVPELDEVLKGCSYGNMIVIAAPPSQFKTTEAVSIAYNGRKAKFNGVLVSLEVMERDMWFNIFSRHALEMGIKLTAESIKKGLLSPEELKQLEEVVTNYESQPDVGKIHVLTPSSFASFKPQHIIAKLEQLEDEHGPIDYIMLDYIQLLRAFRPPGVEFTDYLNDMVRFFTDLAINYRGNEKDKDKSARGLIVFLLSQINRDGERKLAKRKRADLTMLAELNSLEREAHAVIVNHSDPAMRLANQLMVQVCKNRSGRVMSDMVSTYVNPEQYIVGTADFRSTFSVSSVMGEEGDKLFT